MYPVLFEIGDLKIYSFGTFIVLAFLAASLFIRARAHKTLGLDKERVFNICFALLFIALAGARFLFVMTEYEKHAGSPLSAFAVWNGGLVFYGGLIACLLWLAWYLPRHPDLKGWSLLDVLAMGACLAIFVGRWASFLSGENYGKEAPDLPWAITFPNAEETQAPIGVALHPTQIYHSLSGLLLFGLLVLYQRRKPYAGRTAGLFLMLYAIVRSIVEIYRGDAQRGMVMGDISTSQVISIPMFFVGLTIFLVRRPPDAEYASA